MATINLIIGENYLKSVGIINDNADMKVITPTIQYVQQAYIEDLLGTQLYNQILSQIGSSSVSAANQTLLDSYVIPCMHYYILSECTPVFKYRYMNKGVMIKTSENSQSPTLEEIEFLMDKWKNMAEKLAEKVTKFLCSESATYPLYSSNSESYESQPNKNNYTNGLYFDEGEDNCDMYE